MIFGRNFSEKRQIWVSEPHFGEVRGDAPFWLMIVEKSIVDFSFALIEHFPLSTTVLEL